MKGCRFCGSEFDPAQPLSLPEQQAGLLLAEREYADAGEVCGDCLASRGRLAMMYKTECFD
jgi:hypothetical protein